MSTLLYHVHTSILETDLQEVVVQAINQALDDRENILQTLQENVEMVLKDNGKSSETEIEAKLEQLQEKLLKRINQREDYNDIVDEIDYLREVKQNILLEDAESDTFKQKIDVMQKFLIHQVEHIQDYDERLVRQMVQKTTIYENRITIEFKSGISIDMKS